LQRGLPDGWTAVHDRGVCGNLAGMGELNGSTLSDTRSATPPDPTSSALMINIKNSNGLWDVIDRRRRPTRALRGRSAASARLQKTSKKTVGGTRVNDRRGWPNLTPTMAGCGRAMRVAVAL